MFTGFSAAAFEFYRELERDNSKPWWDAHRDVYEGAIREPMLALAAELEPQFGSIKMFRPFRDVRFSLDKSPYKEHAAIVCERSSAGGGLYLQLGARGLRLGGGFFMPAADQLQRFREAVDTPGIASSWRTIIGQVQASGFELMTADSLKSAPRGWPKDHPAIDLLRLKNLAVDRYLDVADWMHDERCLGHIVNEWNAVEPLNEWLAQVVGPSELDRRSPGGML